MANCNTRVLLSRGSSYLLYFQLLPWCPDPLLSVFICLSLYSLYNEWSKRRHLSCCHLHFFFRLCYTLKSGESFFALNGCRETSSTQNSIRCCLQTASLQLFFRHRNDCKAFLNTQTVAGRGHWGHRSQPKVCGGHWTNTNLESVLTRWSLAWSPGATEVYGHLFPTYLPTYWSETLWWRHVTLCSSHLRLKENSTSNSPFKCKLKS